MSLIALLHPRVLFVIAILDYNYLDKDSGFIELLNMFLGTGWFVAV